MTDKNSKNDKQDKNTKPSDYQTTGHNWDGVSEYNIPAPRWWLIVWIICIIWAVIYWFFYPTWPTKSGNTKGSLNWSKFSALKEEQQEISSKKNIYLEQKFCFCLNLGVIVRKTTETPKTTIKIPIQLATTPPADLSA